MVFYYVLTSKGLDSPRQLSNLAGDAVQRMSGHDDRLRYGNLFEVADMRNQRFFAEHQLAAEKLSGLFVQINP
jgi:hypothetical protein